MQRNTPLFVCSMAAAVVAALLLLSAAIPASAQTRICGVIIEKLSDACSEFVQIPGPEENPSEECCALVLQSNVPCLCDNLSPEVEKTISLPKAFFVARECGKYVPAGTKCRDFTVPPPPPMV